MNIQAKRPTRHFAVIVAGSAAILGIAILVLVRQFSASGPPTVIIRGAPADPATFSLTTLQTREDRVLVERIRQGVFQACMVAKGFPEPPGEGRSDYLDRYGRAAFGDDPSWTTPPPGRVVVEIADGVSVALSTSWTPKTCIYQSYSRLGVDALVREGLRQQMMLLVAQGDDAAQEDLKAAASRWGQCLGQEATPQDLLNTIDGVDPLRSPFGADAAACLSDDIRSEAMRIRAEHHLRVAADNEKLVQSWIEALDTELHGAQAAAG